MQNASKTTRRSASRGFTLVELMIVLTVIGIMATMCVPTFQRAIEQSKIDIAAANLRAIWAAERLYWLEYHSYTLDSDPPTHLETLNTLGLLDPGILSDSATNQGGFDYSVNINMSASDPKTLATALRQTDSTSLTLTIDENGEITSTGTTPGFQ
jgi:prepilin-type N-terminal cleavage/methylation domain-containing protein